MKSIEHTQPMKYSKTHLLTISVLVNLQYSMIDNFSYFDISYFLRVSVPDFELRVLMCCPQRCVCFILMLDVDVVCS